jgi:hypothetical protein
MCSICRHYNATTIVKIYPSVVVLSQWVRLILIAGLSYFAEWRRLLSRSAWHIVFMLSLAGPFSPFVGFPYLPMGFTYLLAQLIIFAYWFSDPTRKQRCDEKLCMEWWTGFLPETKRPFQLMYKSVPSWFNGHSFKSNISLECSTDSTNKLTFLEPNNHYKNV